MRYRLVAQEDTSDTDPPGEYLCQGHRGKEATVAEHLIPVGDGGTTVLPLCNQCLLEMRPFLDALFVAPVGPEAGGGGGSSESNP